MPFQPFHTLTSRIVPLRIDHIDTDRIIPARFLTSVESSGYEKFLFHDWRFHPDGSPNASFILNQPKGQGKILLAGRNFGCGSSREHAAWALFQYGFRVVISSGFADIFRTNALNIGLLPIEVEDQELDSLFETAASAPQIQWTVDLLAQMLIPEKSDALVNIQMAMPMEIRFDINAFRKRCLLDGIDLIDYLVLLKPEIEQFEHKLATWEE